MPHFRLIRFKSSQPEPVAPAPEPDSSENCIAMAPKPTPRELEVEELLCRGYSQENIAAIFGRSVHTVSVHTLSLYRKRGVHTQVELLLAYLQRRGIAVFPDDAREQSARQPLSVAP
jgi:DNA-binding CsgD family transcriptional regulator